MNQKIKNEEFEALAFEDQCKVVFGSPLGQRADLVLRSQDPERLVSTFSSDELYLMMREMDNTNIPELIQYANVNQLEFMADFECWDNDTISEEGFIQWLHSLIDAGLEKLRQWLLTTDFNMVVAGFKKYITVLKPYHEEVVDEVIGSKPYFTLDGLYYIMIDEENMETVKRAIEVLFQDAKDYYISLLEGIMSEVDAEIEEDAFCQKRIRLAEKGFPAQEDAFRIYRVINQDEWNQYSLRVKKENQDVSAVSSLPLYPTIWSEEKLFIDDVLTSLVHISESHQRDIYQEFVWLSNKIICCEGLHNFGEEQVKKALNHARYMINIALEDLSSRDLSSARRILAEHWLEYIFRWGVTCVIRIREKAERTLKAYWDYSLEKLYDFLSEPYSSYVRGIMRARPLLFDPRTTEYLNQLRDFRTNDEVRNAGDIIASLEYIFKLLYSKPLKNWSRFLEYNDSSLNLIAEDVKVSTLLFTVFCNYIIKSKCTLIPISVNKLGVILKTIFEGEKTSDEVRHIKQEFKTEFIKTMTRVVEPLSQQEFNSLRSLFEVTFKTAEDELSLLPADSKLKKEFIHSVIIRSLKNS